MKQLMIVLSSILFIGASIEMDLGVETPKLPPLQVMCPYDRFVFYDCSTEDAFMSDMPWDYSGQFCSPRPGIAPMQGELTLICPICGRGVIKILREDKNGAFGQVFTNKGWKP